MSSSTAAVTIPSPTTQLRAVRSVPSTADRWPTPAPVRSAPASQRPAAIHQVVPETPVRLPEGAVVVAALPQSVLPPGLLAQYGTQRDGDEHPLVGYLVLVTADQVERPTAEPTEPRPAAHGITIDTDRRSARVDGRLLDLTYLEFELLAYFTAHPHRVYSRDQLVDTVWGYGHIGDGRTVDVHVARLRRKLGAAHRSSIVTVRRVGYQWVPTG